MKFCLCLQDFQNFEIHFLEFPWKIFCNYLYLKFLENAVVSVFTLHTM